MKGMIRMGEAEYPEMLRGIKQPPKVINYIGDVSLLGSHCVAIVGSRKCTPYGRAVARSLGRRMAECGITVVSGMAGGIDRAAHEGALEIGGATIAVLGCGVDICYPLGNRDIKRMIEEKGLIISEYEDGTEPVSWNFPFRNRIISGISKAVVVVEAAMRSGSLITAEYALDQSRTLYAVPSNINSKEGYGSNDLLRSGAIPLIKYDDVVTDMGLEPATPEKVAEKMEGEEKEVFDIISSGGEITIDQICNKILLDPQTVKGIITVLEMKGMVVCSMGRVFVNNIAIDS